MAQVIVGAAWEFAIPCERCVSASAFIWFIATLIRTGRHCIALDDIRLQLQMFAKSKFLH